MSDHKLERPNRTEGLRHVALFVEQFEECEKFYADLIGMTVEWRPDADNVYLTSNTDNLALHRMSGNQKISTPQKLDHIGFILSAMADVDDWYVFLQANNVKMQSQPKTHRDGARSFYCLDPDNTVVQMIFHPPISNKKN